MMNLIEDVSVLSNEELVSYSVKLAHHENDIGLRIIACLREVERRMLYCELGLGSLWDYATQYLGLSNGNAQMKISAMRLARDNPIAREKIETGELSIPNAAKVNSFFRQESKAGNDYSPEEKAEVIESVLGLSQSKCEKTLLTLAPESIPAEQVRPLTETKTELRIVIDENTMAVLERLKDLLSHKMPNSTYAQLLDYLAREKVEVLERKQMGVTMAELEKQSSQVTPPSGVKQNKEKDQVGEGRSSKNSGQRAGDSSTLDGVLSAPTPRQYISVEDRRWVMRRAKGQCESVAQDGHRCTSKRYLELDHIVPLACGGKNDRTNFRVVCKQHNLFYAKVNLGEQIMGQYVPSMK